MQCLIDDLVEDDIILCERFGYYELQCIDNELMRSFIYPVNDTRSDYCIVIRRNYSDYIVVFNTNLCIIHCVRDFHQTVTKL